MTTRCAWAGTTVEHHRPRQSGRRIPPRPVALWRARCACGWTSRLRALRADAVAEWDEHTRNRNVAAPRTDT